jgi:methionyl-tRNA synthetase
MRAVDSLKTLLAPWLPFSSERLHQTLGYTEPLFGQQEIVTIEEQERSHEALVYDGARATGRWEPSDLKPGGAFERPKPLFKKLDEDLVGQERERLG